MPIIRISEIEPENDGFTVSVTFDGADQFDGLTVHNPLTEQNRARLEWHFEQYVGHPYLKDVEPAEAEKIVREEGEALFGQLFGRADIFSRYERLVREDANALVIEIAGSPEFHSLHWESLKDPRASRPFALDALILRKDLAPQNFPADVREASTINLLVVTSRPAGRHDVGYRTISRPLVELLHNASLPVRVHILRPATFESFSKHLDEVPKGFYHVVHFDVHGALLTFAGFEKIEKQKAGNNLTFQITRYGRPEIKPYKGKDAFLFFDLYREPESKNDDGFRADPVRADELANLLDKRGVPLVILNACQSAKELGAQKNESGTLPIAAETSLASRLMQSGAQMVLAMSYSVTVTAARILMKSLYQELFRGRTVEQAIQKGRKELAGNKKRRAAFNLEITLEDWLLPVVYQKRAVGLKAKTPAAEEQESLYLAQAELGEMPAVEYGFHGRDILNIERRVLLKNNILLIRGMGGAGKTTLLEHLAWWWRATGFIKKVFYFGYDKQAYTRQQIVLEIAQALYQKFEFAKFQAMDERAQVEMLAQTLRAERHLLILDNLESIQGGYFAVKNTLTPAEQTKLRDFLAKLRGADDAFQEQTIVLLGSRSAEEWLADRTFRRNLYDLGGLDAESATQFAEAILRENEVGQYRSDPDFKKLLKLLAGFPLPMKVLFGNLRRQTPSEILGALKAGDVDLNTGSAEDKTADILKCIEYSHSNIAPEKQELLLCLAPFTSVVNRMSFEHYIEELKKHAALAHLRHELWDEVFTESVGRGLMSEREDLPVYDLQPILPYFLKTEWQKAERNEFKKAVQVAFRDYFDRVSGSIYQLMNSKQANEKMLGQFLVGLEFENIDTCLEYSLVLQTSILKPFSCLSAYYDAVQNQQAGLDLGTKVQTRMESYPSEILAGAIGLEFIGVLDDIAMRQLLLKIFEAAEISYQKALELLFINQDWDDKQKKKGSASIYHQLGNVAQAQREWSKAEEYYKQALEIFIEYNDRYEQAGTFHQLGIVAQEQREWPKAEEYYKQALEIYIEYNDRYSQARTFHNLGIVAQNQREWAKAEEYYKQALAIFIEYNDRYSQASTFHQLGRVAQEQREWTKAEEYYKQALEIFRDFSDGRNLAITLSSLSNLWKESGDDELIGKVAAILGLTEADVRELFEREPGASADGDEGNDG